MAARPSSAVAHNQDGGGTLLQPEVGDEGGGPGPRLG
jgi:hypothetical protein